VVPELPPVPLGELLFHPLAAPTRAEVAEVARRAAERIEKILRAHGRSLDPAMQDHEPAELCADEPGLAACYAAAARGAKVLAEQRALRLVLSQDRPENPQAAAEPDEPVAEVRGINVHAKQRVDERDRKQFERLCRYITRPPLAQDRLELRAADGLSSRSRAFGATARALSCSSLTIFWHG
jgi:hypothetical protein